MILKGKNLKICFEIKKLVNFQKKMNKTRMLADF